MVENECISAYNESYDLFNSAFKQCFSEDKPKSFEEMFQTFKVNFLFNALKIILFLE